MKSLPLLLAAAMFAPAAYADVLNLDCVMGQAHFAFHIDLDIRTAQAGDGVCSWNIHGQKETANDCPAVARNILITDDKIEWATTSKTMDGTGKIHPVRVSAGIDRIAGTFWYQLEPEGRPPTHLTGICQRAGRKF